MRLVVLAFVLGCVMNLGGVVQPAWAQSPTLNAVRARGVVRCGVAGTAVGFSLTDSHGVMQGIDVDGCHALAAAIFGDPNRAALIVTTTQNRFTALQAGDVDVLFREVTWTLPREARLGLLAGVPYFYDGTGFLVKTDSGIRAARQLDGATICIQPGTSTELVVADYFRDHGMTLHPVEINDWPEVQHAFLTGRCDALANDRSSLAGIRAAQGPRARDLILLPDSISKEPLAPMVRQGDDSWFNLVRWVSFAQITAEEDGVSSQTIDQMRRDSTRPDIRRLLGVTGDLGAALGVRNDWAYWVIKTVGNTAEVWNRDIAPLDIPRGVNRLWDQGGIVYAPPLL